MKILLNENQFISMIDKILELPHTCKNKIKIKLSDMIKQRNNDTMYLSLNEVVGDYRPSNKIPSEMVEWYINKLNLLEEGDTIITGSFNEWILVLGIIFDNYLKNEK